MHTEMPGNTRSMSSNLQENQTTQEAWFFKLDWVVLSVPAKEAKQSHQKLVTVAQVNNKRRKIKERTEKRKHEKLRCHGKPIDKYRQHAKTQKQSKHFKKRNLEKVQVQKHARHAKTSPPSDKKKPTQNKMFNANKNNQVKNTSDTQ